MKKDIHPESYRLVVFKDFSCDESFLTRSCTPTKDTIVWEDGKEYPKYSPRGYLSVPAHFRPPGSIFHRKNEIRGYSRADRQVQQEIRKHQVCQEIKRNCSKEALSDQGFFIFMAHAQSDLL